MGAITEILREWASTRWEKFDLAIGDEQNSARLAFDETGEGGAYACFLEVDEERVWLRLFMYAPNEVPPDKSRPIGDLIHLINPELNMGYFELFPETRIRYRAGIDIEGGVLAPTMIENMVRAGVYAMGRYFPAYMSVLFGGLGPERALALLEGNAADEAQDAGSAPGNDGMPVPEWVHLPGTGVVKAWAAEVKEAITSGNGAHWPLIGPAVLVCHDDTDECALLAQRTATESGIRYARVSSEQIREMIPGLRRKMAALAPVLVYLDPGDWQERADSNRDAEAAAALVELQSVLALEVKSFDPANPVLVMASCKSPDFVAPALRELGTFDRCFVVPPLSNEAIGSRFVEMLGRDLCDDSMTTSLAKLGILVRGEYDSRASLKLAALHLMRLARRGKRKIGFNDVANLVIRDAAEMDTEGNAAVPDHVRHRTAIHEAGHAAMAILASDGRNVPDFASIVPGRGFAGIVMESVNYADAGKNERSYADVQQKVRIGVAGRAAEEVVFGANAVSAGAASDLERATRLALDAMGLWGFAPDMDAPGASGSNLAVVLGAWDRADYQTVYPLTRAFLAKEYAQVIALLSQHRPLLDAIAERLMWDPLVDQQELVEICRAIGIDIKTTA